MTELVLFCGIMGPICGVLTVFCLLERLIDRIERAVEGRRHHPVAAQAYFPPPLLLDDHGRIAGAVE